MKGFIIQNANAYMEGVGDAPRKVLLPLWEKRTPETEKPEREFVSLEGTKFHWLVGAKEPAIFRGHQRAARRRHVPFRSLRSGYLDQRVC